MNALKKLLLAAPTVVSLLILQIAALLVSFNSRYEISVFCTGPASCWLSLVFGLLHLSFLVLLALGVTSLVWEAARPVYITLILVALAALPVQAMLVHAHILQCDFP